jgi:hypothetical protein
MRRNKFLAALAVTGAMLAIAPAYAAEGGTFQEPQETFVGRFMSKTAACPSLDFHLTEAADKKVTGMAFDPMMSGQMSSLAGAVGTDGKVHLTMTAVGGKGPSGTIDGTMQGTTMVLSMASASCPMATVKLMPVQHEIHESTG